MKELKVNLRLFADGATGANPITTTTQATLVGGLSIEMKEFYSKDLLEMVGPALVHAQFGEKVSIPRGSGKTIEWRKFSTFKDNEEVSGGKTNYALTEGVTPDANTLKVTPVTATLAQYGDWSMVSDLLDLEAIDNIVVEYTKKHAENAARILDGLVRAAIRAGCTQYTLAGANKATTGLDTDGKIAATSTAAVTVNDIKRVVTYLKQQNAPKIDGSYVAIINPAVAYDIMKDTQWIDVSEYSAATQIFEGELGKLYGVRFVETTEAYIEKTGSGSSEKTHYITYFLGKDAYKVVNLDGSNVEVIVKNPDGSSTNDPLNQRSTIGWKCNGYTAQVTIPEYIYGLVSGSTLA